jgi:hypothetical protein
VPVSGWPLGSLKPSPISLRERLFPQQSQWRAKLNRLAFHFALNLEASESLQAKVSASFCGGIGRDAAKQIDASRVEEVNAPAISNSQIISVSTLVSDSPDRTIERAYEFERAP